MEKRKFIASTILILGIVAIIIALMFLIFPNLFKLCLLCTDMDLFALSKLLVIIGLATSIYSIIIFKSKENSITILKYSIFGLLVLLLFIVLRKGFNQDEIEHLHVAWLISQGFIPYKEFFEVHTPIMLYILSLIPGIDFIGDKVYRMVAKHRYKL